MYDSINIHLIKYKFIIFYQFEDETIALKYVTQNKVFKVFITCYNFFYYNYKVQPQNF